MHRYLLTISAWLRPLWQTFQSPKLSTLQLFCFFFGTFLPLFLERLACTAHLAANFGYKVIAVK